VTDDAGRAWDALEPPWHAVLDEAWASWCASCFGIGAVIVDGGGRIVTRGRNRILDRPIEPGMLGGNQMAHAEMNALAVLPLGEYSGYRLYTSLEPCLMCASAITTMRIPEVCFAALDPVFDGLHEHMAGHAFVAARAPERHGPLNGVVARFAGLLPLTFIAFWTPHDDAILELHRVADPDMHELAVSGTATERLTEVRDAGGTTLDALTAVGRLLAR
jgi:tRNA(Arg) A34 adenosine deaminase TadA